MSFSLSLVIPVHNEEKTIKDSIKKIHNYLSDLKINFEIIISNNGSIDRTEEFAKELILELQNVKLITNQKRGLGIGIRQGIENACKDFVMFYAIDLPFGLEIIEESINACGNEKQIVIGSKHHYNSKTKIPPKRYIASKLYNLLLNVLFKINVRDTQGSLLFSNKEVKQILKYIDSDTPFLQTQIILYLVLFGNKIKEIPVEYLIYRADSKIKLFSDGSSMLKELYAELSKYYKIKNDVIRQ